MKTPKLAAIAFILAAPLSLLADQSTDRQIENTAKASYNFRAAVGDRVKIKAADGVVWLIDLGNPNQTERSGFTAASAKPGDAVVVLGNRDKDKSKMHMKAVRITVAGKQYDMYPERIRTN